MLLHDIVSGLSQGYSFVFSMTNRTFGNGSGMLADSLSLFIASLRISVILQSYSFSDSYKEMVGVTTAGAGMIPMKAVPGISKFVPHTIIHQANNTI
jgi:hypothetical protein